MDAYFSSANNFYLYQNEDDNRFEWIIWDVNLAFSTRGNFPDLDIFYLPTDRPLTKNIVLYPDFKK
ncbi:MAG: CotH kinase family protein, partial [Calditrichaceae bacterium]